MLSLEEVERVLPRAGWIHAPSLRPDATANIHASPATTTDGGSVTLTISFSSWVPTPDDYVTVSCGSTAGLDDYLDAVTLNDRASSDVVQVRFSDLVFMRCDYVFVYVAVTTYPALNHTAIGKLRVPSAEKPDTPKQGHLVYVNDPTRMVVKYVSSSPNPAPAVRFGLSPSALRMVAEGTSSTYGADSLCHAPANQTAQQWFRDPGFIHSVELAGLTPATVYFYQFGNEQAGWSEVLSFRTAPNSAVGVKFAAYGDQDVGEAARNTTQLVLRDILTRGTEFVLHFGDLGYALGKQWIWDKWGSLVAPVASRVPYMVTVGNHEYDYNQGHEHDPSGEPDTSFLPPWWNNGPTASQGECGRPTFARFDAESNGNSVFWYSFVYGNVFVLQFSSEHDFTVGSKQWTWMDAQLRSVDRDRTPWVVVATHRPIYTTQECEVDDYVVSLHMRDALDDMFYKYRVNVALVAHTHSYERTCAVYRGECTNDGTGTVHLTVGSAGAGLEDCGYSSRYGNFSRAHINTWGYLRVETTADHMLLQFVLDSDSSVWDEYVVKPWGSSPAVSAQ